MQILFYFFQIILSQALKAKYKAQIVGQLGKHDIMTGFKPSPLS
jgi:hypothetical protein